MPRKFDFISPDIQLNEVDESILPPVAPEVGPLLMGRALKGPAMRPVRVSSLQDFYDIFGKPITGKGAANADVWRDGNLVAPTYASFAAQAHLASSTTPVTFVRLLGKEDASRTSLTGQAGWYLTNEVSTADDTINDSAYGLFIIASGSETQHSTGSLCAVFYADGAMLALTGTLAAGAGGSVPVSEQTHAGAFIQSSAAGEFTMVISSSAKGSEVKTFSMVPGSEKYIRNQFNTNPQKLDASSNFGTTNEVYFLGETYEQAYEDNILSGKSATGELLGLVLPLQKGTGNTNNLSYHLAEARQARTGWFINRTQSGAQQRLFRLIAHSEGEWPAQNYHIEISDLKLGNIKNPNSTFSVKIMQGKAILEKYSGCNLDPSSADYVAKRIGDQYQDWDATNKKYNVRGDYPNKSDYVYIDMDATVENQELDDANALPAGFYGPLRQRSFSVCSGSLHIFDKAASPVKGTNADVTATSYLRGEANVPLLVLGDGVGEEAGGFVRGMTHTQTASFDFPTFRLTEQNTKQGGNYQAVDTFGVRHIRGSQLSRDDSYKDLVRYFPAAPENDDGVTIPAGFERAFTFTLEDIVALNSEYYYSSGSATYENDLDTLLKLGVRQYRVPLVGGYDGLDVTKTDPLSANHVGSTRVSSYVRNTYEFALDTIADTEVVEYDVLSSPGMTHEGVSNRLIQVCEDRGDALGVIDLVGIYENKWENGGSVDNGAASTAISTAESRLINSSYVATYYPSVKLRDSANGNGDIVTVPPSVAAIGALAKSQGLSEPWFAPAGFNRGGINELGGSNGPRIVGTTEHLTKAERDDLYEQNINPIARFPASGDIVIFGQKTMQQQASALNRINVRRLLLYLKRKIGKVSETILFDNNVQSTWNRFKFQADRILSDVQSRLGITEYKLVLDETTTTADLVDRNILYAKVLIKPARAIEFIVVDFVVTRSGIEL